MLVLLLFLGIVLSSSDTGDRNVFGVFLNIEFLQADEYK